MQNAAAFAQALSMAGLSIISGLALGIDTHAHEGGLCGAGATIAVIGTGADLVYPRRNLALAQNRRARLHRQRVCAGRRPCPVTFHVATA